MFCYLGYRKDKRGVNLYKYVIIRISFLAIPMMVYSGYSLWYSLILEFSPAGPDATGLSTILNGMAYAGLGVFFFLGIGLMIIVYGGIIGVLWIIYAIWKSVQDKKEHQIQI